MMIIPSAAPGTVPPVPSGSAIPHATQDLYHGPLPSDGENLWVSCCLDHVTGKYFLVIHCHTLSHRFVKHGTRPETHATPDCHECYTRGCVKL